MLILTDMELSAKGWEGTAHRGEITTATACLETKEGMVQKPEIVSRLNVRGTLKATQESSCIFADKGNGLYGGSLKMPDEAGRHDIEIIAKSPTFERRVLKNVNVFDQLYTVEAENKNPHAGEAIVLKIVASDKAAKEKMDFQATIQMPDGTRSNSKSSRSTSLSFQWLLKTQKREGDYRITVTGTLGEGADAYQEVFGPLDVHVAAEAPVEVALPPMEKPSVETPVPEKKVVAEPTPAPVKAAQSSSLLTPLNLAIGGGALLLLLIIAILLTVLIMRRPKAAPEPKLPVDELRKRAAAIREETYEVPPAAVPSLDQEPVSKITESSSAEETDVAIGGTTSGNAGGIRKLVWRRSDSPRRRIGRR